MGREARPAQLGFRLLEVPGLRKLGPQEASPEGRVEEDAKMRPYRMLALATWRVKGIGPGSSTMFT